MTDDKLHPPTSRRSKRIKPGVLAAYYAKLKYDRPDVVLHNEAPARRCDAHFLHSVLNTARYDCFGKREPSIIEELVNRGYDLTTLNFSIKMHLRSEPAGKETKP